VTWEKRELVLLRAIAQADEEGHAVNRASDLLSTGLSQTDIAAGLRALTDARMIGGINATTHPKAST